MVDSSLTVEEQKTLQLTKFIENVKQVSISKEETEVKPDKSVASNIDIRTTIARVFQTSQHELQTFKNGKELPRGFAEFVRNPLCYQTCDAILDYCKYLIKLDKKKVQLEKDAKLRKIPAPKVLRSETDKLNLKAKRMSDCYGRMIFLQRSVGQVDEEKQRREKQAYINAKKREMWRREQGLDEDDEEVKPRTPSPRSFIQFRSVIDKNGKNDIAFYQSVVRLYGKVLSECFQRNDLPTVIMELERLFKTNLFNESQRSQSKAAMEEQYPALKDFTPQELNVSYLKSEQMQPMKARIEARINLKRQLNVLPNQKFQVKPAYSPRGEIRPLFVNLTAHTASQGRSPLISLMFPTIKDKVTNLEATKVVNPTELKEMAPQFLANTQLEFMVKQETRSRHARHYSTIR